MDKITLNGKQYIALGEFNHIRKNLVKDIYERYEKDENGQYHLSEADIGRVDAYAHIMTAIMEDEIRSAETPDEIREIRKKLENEFLLHNYIITSNDNDTGERIYFRKYCEPVNDDGEYTPVFTTVPRLAKTWTDYYYATIVAGSLKQRTGDDSIRAVPACYHLLPPGEAEKRLLNAIFGDSEDDSGGVE